MRSLTSASVDSSMTAVSLRRGRCADLLAAARRRRRPAAARRGCTSANRSSAQRLPRLGHGRARHGRQVRRVRAAPSRSMRTVRLSSTMRTVPLMARASAPTPLQRGEPRARSRRAQDLLRGAEHHRLARHAVDDRRRLVLGDRQAAGLADLEQAARAVPAHARSAGSAAADAPYSRRDRLEQHVDRRPAGMPLGIVA